MIIETTNNIIQNEQIEIEDNPVMCFKANMYFYTFVIEPRIDQPDIHYQIKLMNGNIAIDKFTGKDNIKYALSILYQYADDVKQISFQEFIDEFESYGYSYEILNTKKLKKLNKGKKLDLRK